MKQTVKNAGGYFEKRTVHFLVSTGYIIKISMTDDVEKVLKMSVLMVVEKFSYAVNVHRTTQNICWSRTCSDSEKKASSRMSLLYSCQLYIKVQGYLQCPETGGLHL